MGAWEVERKNAEAWSAFKKTFVAKFQGRLPPWTQKVSPPGYRKDGETGRRRLWIHDARRNAIKSWLTLPGAWTRSGA